MDIEKLRTFVAASHSSTFYEAANRLFITPSTVSKHISALEEEFGVTLFHRTSSKLEHTKEGLLCLRSAEKIVEEYDNLYSCIASPGRGTLRISTIFEQWKLLHILEAFSRRYPDIRIELEDCHGNEVVRNVLSGKCALGYAGSVYSDLPELERCIFGRQRIVAVLSVNHPLAGRAEISISDLKNEDFYLLHPESGAYRARIAMCLEHGFQPRVKRTCSRDELLLENVRESGVTLVGEDVVKRFQFPDIRAIPLAEEYYLGGALIRLKKAPLSPNAKLFWDFFVQSVKSQAPTV